MENAFNIIFPPKCVFCGTVGNVFCDNCISNCSILQNQRCLICDKNSFSGETHYHHSFDLRYLSCGNGLLSPVLSEPDKVHVSKYPSQLVCPFVYEGNVRECIRKSKYSQKLFMCLKRLAFEGVNLIYEWGYSFNDFCVLSIPISKQREQTRGFNQVDVISKVFAKRFGLEIKSFLKRTRDKKAQHGLTRFERFKNVEGAFYVDGDVLGKNIILIDDICTTGATFLEASKVLFEKGAKDIKCFALSKKL